jgi:hypothetical protein
MGGRMVMHMLLVAGRVAGVVASALLGTTLSGTIPASALAADCGTWSTTQIAAAGNSAP